MVPTFTVKSERQRGDRGLHLQGSCCNSAAAVQLVAAAKQLLAEGISPLWMDCHQLQVMDRCGQQAILQIEQLASRAQVTVYWRGFSEPVVQQLSATGLYLLLRHAPVMRRGTYLG
ncbi:STAS domain-containing protein [Hymenobacter sediminis]|uniref:STAS domain-containing protein n=1 Tax=Hymenobacter sediminis TaxID=2218621 RepID=UPI000DA69249|nr:STAS domain-containing protein [Hymenobacter sediminis]